jgi:hypothetical protein
MSEGNGLSPEAIQRFIDADKRGHAEGYARALRAAAALIRAAEPMTLRILPTTHDGEMVVRDLREELASKVEGLA